MKHNTSSLFKLLLTLALIVAALLPQRAEAASSSLSGDSTVQAGSTVTLTLSGSCTAEPVTPPALVSSSRLDEEEPAFSAVVTGLSASSPRNAATPSRYACHVMTAPPPRYSLHSPSVSLRL